MSQIDYVHARQILDSRGNPTVEVEVTHRADDSVKVWGRLGVPEVWRYDVDRGTLTFGVRQGDGRYTPVPRSAAFPELGPDRLPKVLTLYEFDDVYTAPRHGFAVRAEDVRGATPERPAELSVVDESRAGAPASRSPAAGGAVAIRAALKRAGLEPEEVEYVVMGEVLQAGVGQAPARQAAVAAGMVLNNMGALARSQGDLNAARSLLEQALEIARAHGIMREVRSA